jgi:hypothetical protein
VAEVYPVPLRQRLPSIRIPLREQEPDIRLDLQLLIDQAYRNGRYARTLNYKAPADPPLPKNELPWARERIRQHAKGARSPRRGAR